MVAALEGPWQPGAGSRLESRLHWWDGGAQHTLALEACEDFYPAPFLFQKSGRVETLDMLELQIAKELEDLGILKS